MRNPGSTPALALEITSPGGFETYYHDMAAVTSLEEALAVQAEYGITFHGDLAAQLITRRLAAGDLRRKAHGRARLRGGRLIGQVSVTCRASRPACGGQTFPEAVLTV